MNAKRSDWVSKCLWAFLCVLTGAGGHQVQAQTLESSVSRYEEYNEKTRQLALAWRGFWRNLTAQTITPVARLQAVEKWKLTNHALLDRYYSNRMRRVVSRANDWLSPPPIPATVYPPGATDDEKSLIDFQYDIAVAINEIRAKNLAPLIQIERMDEFLRLNRSGFQEAAGLRSKIAQARSRTTGETASLDAVGGTKEEIALLEREQAIRSEIERWRAKIKLEQLSPEQRVLSTERERPRLDKLIRELRFVKAELRRIKN